MQPDPMHSDRPLDVVEARPVSARDLLDDVLIWVADDHRLPGPWRVAVAAAILASGTDDATVDALCARARVTEELERAETATWLRLLELPLGSLAAVPALLPEPLVIEVAAVPGIEWSTARSYERPLLTPTDLTGVAADLTHLLAPVDEFGGGGNDLGEELCFEELLADLQAEEWASSTSRARRSTSVVPGVHWTLLDGPYAGRQIQVDRRIVQPLNLPWIYIYPEEPGEAPIYPLVAAPLVRERTAVRAALRVIAGQLPACDFTPLDEVLSCWRS